MDHALLARTNLNLLLTLDALLEERSVTRAAARLGVTQSAVSHALRQLREQLGDRLFVRARGAMAPTPRALALAGPLRQGLRALQQALEDAPEFDPARSRRRFVLATTDLVAATVSPALVARLREEA
ncbi:MAG TPA: LysR family transcriptional regulator, partial [Polyangiaceae bacterium LLY-WYZ-15_(1-7)]|nr:LysR family transcriptional regulator [Polyangiaceae bacterium LLY-WYZ-15_(1-7)]